MEVDCNFNSPFFLCNMKEALAHFGTIFDAAAAAFPEDNKSRTRLEQHLAVGNLVNVVACDGTNRWMRTENLEQWRGRLERNGFRIRPIQQCTLDEVEERIKNSSLTPAFHVRLVEGAAEFLWKERSIVSLSSWRVMC